MTKRKYLASAAVISALSFPAFEVAAQTAALDEIVVTARKREESLQDVPISITAYSGDQLERANYAALNDIARVTPNVYFEGFDRARPNLYVRGIGSRQYDPGTDPSVGVFIDGVYIGRFGALDLDLLDVERIEVLKGPQGTLYGRNTIGGAISVITADPGQEFGGEIGVGTGFGAENNENLYEVSGKVSGPIGGGLSALLTGAIRKREGYTVYPGKNYRGGEEDMVTLRGVVKGPLLGGTFRLSADFLDSADGPIPFRLNTFGGTRRYVTPPRTGLPDYSPPTDPYVIESNEDQHLDRKSYGASATLEFPVGEATLTSITAYRRLKQDELIDTDISPNRMQAIPIREDADQISQELRLSGGGDRLTWLVGVYYGRETADRYDGIISGPDSVFGELFGGGLRWDFDVAFKTRSYAVFGQAQYNLTNKLSATVGLRYSKDKKDAIYTTNTSVPGFVITPFVVDLDKSYDSIDPAVSLSYKPSNNLMVYSSWSSGYKSGGFQYIATSVFGANRTTEPERVDSYEVGLKSTVMDGRLRLNAAAFLMDYKDLQVYRIVPVAPGVTAPFISNAATSRIKGLELETLAVLSSSLQLGINYSYLDAKYKTFIYSDTQDFSGNRMPRSPKHTASATLMYSAETALGWLDARLSYSWKSKVYFEPDNNVVDPESSRGPIGLLDGSVALNRDAWTLALWGTNLTDERYIQNTLNSTGNAQRQVWSEPRTVGLRVSYRFK